MDDKNFPSPEEIQKEFEDFVKKRFGGHVQVISQTFPQPARRAKPKKDPAQEEFSLEFGYKPRDIKQYLDRFVVKQDEAKKVLAIAVCDHYNQVMAHHKDPSAQHTLDYAKQNVLVLGPTGVGKTYMIRQIAQLIGVPFVKADATRFSETGYMGANVEDLVRDLVNQAEGNIKKAQYGIVYLDEADKLASRGGGHGKDVNGRGVQLGLLKLMEETEVDLRAGNDPASQLQSFMEMQQKGRIDRQVINTRHILFIVSGAFTGLEEIIGKRLGNNQIGFFTATHSKQQLRDRLFKEVTSEDLIEFGFEPEFIGRLPIRVACEELDEKSLYEVLENSEGSIVRQYQESFRSYGIQAHFTPCALQEIAKQAVQERTGARGLMTICERSLRPFKYELPSSDIQEFTVDAAVIADPLAQLQKLQDNLSETLFFERKSIRFFEENFEKTHSMHLRFNEAATRKVAKRARKLGQPADELCEDLLQGYQHGLKLIEQNTGQSDFIITAEVVTHPKATLEKWIRESYIRASEDEANSEE
jgi:ATP-dependent Clp protease ATP-binding subunit ClpX